MAATVLLDPGVPDLAALGAGTPEDLLGAGAPLEGEPAAERLDAPRGVERLRLPLPGTLPGILPGRPRGAGTGWVELARYAGAPLGERLAARFTHPRSDSLAGREWNLLCALRRAGVVTPQPLAVAREEHPLFAPRSALVVRALEGARPLAEFLAAEADPGARRRACRALGLALARLDAAGVDLPLTPARLALLADDEDDRPDGVADACGLEQVLAARRDAPRGEGLDFSRGLAWRRLPEVVVTDVRGGRLRGAPTLERLLPRLCRALALPPAEGRRVVLAATADRARRRRLLG